MVFYSLDQGFIVPWPDYMVWNGIPCSEADAVLFLILGLEYASEKPTFSAEAPTGGFYLYN